MEPFSRHIRKGFCEARPKRAEETLPVYRPEVDRVVAKTDSLPLYAENTGLALANHLCGNGPLRPFHNVALPLGTPDEPGKITHLLFHSQG
jgi:hypothetical protein